MDKKIIEQFDDDVESLAANIRTGAIKKDKDALSFLERAAKSGGYKFDKDLAKKAIKQELTEGFSDLWYDIHVVRG